MPLTAINAAIDALVKLTKIETAVATANNQFTVTFNKAVNTTSDKLTVKKGSVNVNLDAVTFAADGLSAVIETTTNLTKGDYVITLTAADNTSTKTVTAADEKVSTINILTETAPLNLGTPTINTVAYSTKATIFVQYEVLNQYGQKMTNPSITWTPSTGGQVANNTTDGVLTIGNSNNTTAFIPGATVYLTGVHATSGTVVNDSVVVGLESKVDTTEFLGVYNNSTRKLEDLPAGFADNKYLLLFEVNDQYGNKIDTPDLDTLLFTSSNPLLVLAPDTDDATTVTIDDVEYQAVPVVRGTNADKGGATTIQAISTVTGKTATYDISTEAKAAVKTFTMSAPADIVSEGGTIEIPFAAADQSGNAIVKYDDLNGKVQFTGNAKLELVKKADGTAKLVYTAPGTGATADADYTAYLTSLVTDGGNFSSLMMAVKETAVPTTVAGLDSDIQTSIAPGGSVDILAEDMIILDQYGRVIKDADVNTWITVDDNAIVLDSIAGATSPFSVASTADGDDGAKHVIDAATDEFTITGKTLTNLDPTEKMIFSLSADDGVTNVTSSSKSVTFTLAAQSEFVSYEVTDLGTMYNNGDPGTKDATHAITVKAFGVKADGTKVAIPAGQISATVPSTVLLAASGNTIDDKAAGGYDVDDYTNTDGTFKTIAATVTVEIENDSTGTAAAVIEKPLVISFEAPVVNVVEFDTDLVDEGAAFVEMATGGVFTDAELDDVIDTTTMKDQYGVDITATPAITISALTKVDGSTFTVTGNSTATVDVAGAAEGDKFTATFKYAGGKSISCNFTVADAITVSSVAVKTAPTDVTYDAGDALDLTDLVVTVTYSDASTEDIALANFATRGVTTDPANGATLAADDDSVVITVGGKSVTQVITTT